MFSVSSIFVCPKYLATNVTLAPLLIKMEAQECLTEERRTPEETLKGVSFFVKPSIYKGLRAFTTL